MMARVIGLATMSRNQTYGSFSVNLTVYLSTTSTLSRAASIVAVGIALLGHEALERVLHVVRRELAAVHGRLGVPAHALAQLEDVGRLVRLRPRLGEVALEGEGAGLHPRPRLVLQQPAMGERVEHVGFVGDGQVRVEVGRVPEPQGQGTAALRRLRGGRACRGAERRLPRRGAASCLQQAPARDPRRVGDDGPSTGLLWSSLTRGVSNPARVCDTLGINPGHVKRGRTSTARSPAVPGSGP